MQGNAKGMQGNVVLAVAVVVVVVLVVVCKKKKRTLDESEKNPAKFAKASEHVLKGQPVFRGFRSQSTPEFISVSPPASARALRIQR